jgi:hypothetical protein
MSKYADRVERNLEGLDAVSTGAYPGCTECAERVGYAIDCDSEDSGELYWFVRRDRERLPGWYETESGAQAALMAEFRLAWEAGDALIEPSFSSAPCGICDSPLGGDREVWHGNDANGNSLHFSDACVDCVIYLANGEEPKS